MHPRKEDKMSVLDTMKFSQVGYIVKDIEAAKAHYASLFGCEVPPTKPCGGEHVETMYKGQPAPKAMSKLAFFNLTPGVQLELIEPNEEMSTWREYLNEKGEGIHHIAFQVKDMEAVIKACEAEGMTVVQRGYYNDRSGWYTYMDGYEKFKCVIELLESF